MTLLSGELGQRYGHFPRMNYRFVGERWTPGCAIVMSIHRPAAEE
jgi:hypothetical protein